MVCNFKAVFLFQEEEEKQEKGFEKQGEEKEGGEGRGIYSSLHVQICFVQLQTKTTMNKEDRQ